MSVIVKANQLNTLIYKYFLESGLSHSAYTLFNEASLAASLQQFRFDIRAGHLLSILEKGLLYAKIQAHVNFSEYTDCEEGFGLLKPHTCKVVEKVRKERQDVLKQMEEQLNDGIKRTNSIYNASIPNRDFEEIIYEAKGSKYFERFPKIKLPPADADPDGQSNTKLTLTGNDLYTLLYNPDDFELDLLNYDNLAEEITLTKIIPSVCQGQLARSLSQALTPTHLVQLFEGNRVTAFDIRVEELTPIEFTLPLQSQLHQIEGNLQIPQLVCFKNEREFCVANFNSLRVIKKGQGKFFWRAFDQYILIEEQGIRIYSVTEAEPKMTFEGQAQWEQIQLNTANNLFAAISSQNNLLHVYTLDSAQPLFIFWFEAQSPLLSSLFLTSNSVDYLCLLTSSNIKVFDLSLNAYSKVIQVGQYDKEVRQMGVLGKKNKDQLYLVGLGSENLLFYDVSGAKMERVEVESKVSSLKQLGSSKLAMITDSNVYFLVGEYIDVLFK